MTGSSGSDIEAKSREALIRELANLRQRVAEPEAGEVARERKLAGEALSWEYKLRDAENAIRVTIASMDQPEHLCRVVEDVGQQLRRAGVVLDSCSIQVVNEEGTDFVSFTDAMPVEWHDEFMTFLETVHSRSSD